MVDDERWFVGVAVVGSAMLASTLLMLMFGL